MTPEGKVKGRLDRGLKKLAATGKVWYFSPQAGPHGKAGIPDRLVCADGNFIGIECKAGRAEPTALQYLCMKEIDAAGGITFVVRDEYSTDRVLMYIQAIVDRVIPER